MLGGAALAERGDELGVNVMGAIGDGVHGGLWMTLGITANLDAGVGRCGRAGWGWTAREVGERRAPRHERRQARVTRCARGISGAAPVTT